MNPHVNLSKLLALRSIRHDPIISALENAILLGENGMQERNECCSRLITAAENLGLKGNLLSRYLLHVIIYRSNIVSEIMERTGLPPETVFATFSIGILRFYTRFLSHRPAIFSAKKF